MQVDPVLHRVWVRLRSCADAAWPAVLVPLPRSSEIQDTHPAAAGPSVAVAPSRTAVAQIVVHAGDAVNAIYDSSNIHLRLEAMANQQGAAGDTIALTLKRRPGQPLDEPEHRIHGIVRADKTVEVQP